MPRQCEQKKGSLLQQEGFDLYPGFLDYNQQRDLLEATRKIVALAPLYQPVMPRTGKPMSVRMSSCGQWGWHSDRHNGYCYLARHPVTQEKWPPIPKLLLETWEKLANVSRMPDCCLINFYGEDAKMGLHQDRDEEDFTFPVLSVSLGDTARFRIGGLHRKDPTRSLHLYSGDVCVLHGPLRLAYHGIDSIHAGSSALLKEGGRLNFTLRRVRN